MAERLGAEIATLNASGSVADEILDYARRRNASRIVIGQTRRRSFLFRLWEEDVARELSETARDFEITLVSDSKDEQPRPYLRRTPEIERDPGAYGGATIAVAISASLAALANHVLPVPSLSLIFMTGVIATAVRYGLWPSLAAAVLSFFAYNFFFTDPLYTFMMIREDQILTLILFLAASLLTGNLAAGLRKRAIVQRVIAERTALLYEFARHAAGAAAPEEVLRAAAVHVTGALDCETVLLVPQDDTGHLGVAAAEPARDRLDLREMSAADYAWERGEVAGHGSGTLASSRWLFLPITSGERRLAVLGIAYAGDRQFSPVDRRLLDALVDQVALALERTELQRDLEQSRVSSEAERLRTALLSSVSHDLRTPLVSIIGAASTLADPTMTLTDKGRATMAETIRDEGERLDRYIQNLLDMTRLGYGALKLKRVPTDLREIAGGARFRLRGALQRHEVIVDVPEGAAPVLVDPLLIEQVIMNLLDNAAKYAPEGSCITLSARTIGAEMEMSVSDEGPGIPEAARTRVFDMFYRVAAGDVQRAGTGLGLAIARGIIEAHKGSIYVKPALPDGTGTCIVMTVPIANPEHPE